MDNGTETEVTAETFAADHPELFAEVTADAREEGEQAARQSFAAFVEQFKEDPAFCVEQFSKGVSLDEAVKAYNKKLREDNAKLTGADDNEIDTGSNFQFDDERFTDEFKSSAKIQAEFGKTREGLQDYIAFRKAEEKGLVKVSSTLGSERDV